MREHLAVHMMYRKHGRRNMKTVTAFVVLLVLTSMVSGCFSKESNEMGGIDSFFDEICPDGFANNSWYHFPNSTDIRNVDSSIDITTILLGVLI